MFRKKQLTYPSNSRWSILNGEQNGKPMFIRRNDSAKQLATHPEYSYRVGIAIPLHEPNEIGLPTSDEFESLSIIEDKLLGTLESNQDSLQVLSITTNGMREFVYYTRNPEAAQLAISKINSEIPNYEFQYYIDEDKKWKLYKQYT
jgi:hypothetical protein